MLAGQPGRVVCAIAYWLCEQHSMDLESGRQANETAYRLQI